MRKLLVVMTALCAGGAFADYVWNVEADGLWNGESRVWLHGSELDVLGNAPTEDVTIARPVTVTYDHGFDFEPQAGTVVTVSNGAKLIQNKERGNWPFIHGKLVLDNGMADFSAAGMFRVDEAGEVEVKNGGELICNTLSFQGKGGKLTMGADGKLAATEIGDCTSARVEIAGGELNFAGAFPSFKDFTITAGSLSFAGTFAPPANYVLKGGTISLPNNEFSPQTGLVIDGTKIVCSIFSPQAADSVITFRSGEIVTSSSSFDGFWPSSSGTHIDVPANGEIAWTFNGTLANAYAATFGSTKFTYAGAALSEAEFDELFDVIDAGDGAVTIRSKSVDTWALSTPRVTRVGSVATIAGSVLGVQGEKGKLVFVCGTDPDIADGLAAGTVQQSGIGVGEYQIEVPDLAENTVYYYAVGILADKVVQVARSGAFLSSDEMVGFMGGADALASHVANWQGVTEVSTAALNGKDVTIVAPCTWDVNFDSADENQLASLTVMTPDNAALTINQGLRMTGDLTVKSGAVNCTIDAAYFTFDKLYLQGGRFVRRGNLNFSDETQSAKYQISAGEFTNYGEINVDGKAVSDAVLSANVFVFGGAGYQPIQGTATRFVTTIAAPGETIDAGRWGQVPFGLYGSGLLNLIPGTVGENVIPPASGFQFRYDDTDWPARTDEEIRQGLFGEGRIQFNGSSSMDAETFASTFRVLTDETAKTQLLTTWDELGADATGKWTIMDGAVVKLVGNVKLDRLKVKGRNTILDLNGKTLRVPANALRVGGEKIAVGDYTAAQIAEAGWSVKVLDAVGTGKVVVFDPPTGFRVIIR